MLTMSSKESLRSIEFCDQVDVGSGAVRLTGFALQKRNSPAALKARPAKKPFSEFVQPGLPPRGKRNESPALARY
jgi:hypothetical protein